MSEPDPTDSTGPPAKPKAKLDPTSHAWLVAGLGVGSAVLGAPVLALVCFVAIGLWVYATVRLGLRFDAAGILGEIAALGGLIVAYGVEQLWILMRGRYRRDRRITIGLVVVIVGEHVLLWVVFTWLTVRMMQWINELKAATGAY